MDCATHSLGTTGSVVEQSGYVEKWRLKMVLDKLGENDVFHARAYGYYEVSGAQTPEEYSAMYAHSQIKAVIAMASRFQVTWASVMKLLEAELVNNPDPESAAIAVAHAFAADQV